MEFYCARHCCLDIILQVVPGHALLLIAAGDLLPPFGCPCFLVLFFFSDCIFRVESARGWQPRQRLLRLSFLRSLPVFRCFRLQICLQKKGSGGVMAAFQPRYSASRLVLQAASSRIQELPPRCLPPSGIRNAVQVMLDRFPVRPPQVVPGILPLLPVRFSQATRTQRAQRCPLFLEITALV